MTNFGVDVPKPVEPPTRAFTIIASAIWLAVSVPFFYLAHLYTNWPLLGLENWRACIFAIVATGCVVVAIVIPPRYRMALTGTNVRWWARLR